MGKKPDPPPRRPAIWERAAPQSPQPPKRVVTLQDIEAIRERSRQKVQLSMLERRVEELERERRFRG